MSKEEFVKEFNQRYGGYICVDRKIIEDYYNKHYEGFRNKDFNDDCILDFCQDYILSQGLAEEVVE